ncbi:50S ribosomal protein L25/general stress protein Ctc [Rubellimicrobium rubrum]|uniref:Large ribosomal subunit protein bL25 n=1 Tax=Rubellimicrobium rubrum TaxID=2585369 RepID=A0A5C4MVC1_9RHOB|nr:50S ribosomal protein L25/general stress protein Ctc [Rubellimicrobium rubrum]TNC48944.1 50S ribosomal protein L25/general stress protein Ctc [Rubellimicrobium rubrum]
MAGEVIDLVAQVRAGTGKGAARAARREGAVPGIIYGGGQEPLPINLEFNALMKRLKAGHFLSTMFNLKIEGQVDQRVVCRGVQRHVVKDLPTHVDFLRISPTTRINLLIDVVFTNHGASPGLKRGGTLVAVRPQVQLEVTAGEIPDHIEVDLTGRNVGDVIHINDIPLPAGVKPTIERNFVIANISAPSGLRSADNVEEAAS